MPVWQIYVETKHLISDKIILPRFRFGSKNYVKQNILDNIILKICLLQIRSIYQPWL